MPKPKSRKDRDRAWHLLRMARRVGLTGFLDRKTARLVFKEMLRTSGKSCNICGARGALVADHCHRRGRHRGRLCHPCNTALGLMQDDISRLCRAALYLAEFEEWIEGGEAEER